MQTEKGVELRNMYGVKKDTMAEIGTKHWQDRPDLHVKFKRSLTLSFTTCNLYEIWTPLTVLTY